MTTWPESETHCFSLTDQTSQSNVYRLQVANNPRSLAVARAAIDLHKEVCTFLPQHDCATVVKADIATIEKHLEL